MKLRKVLALVLVLCLTVGIVGCSKKEDKPADQGKDTQAQENQEGQPLVVYAFDGGYGQEGWKAVVEAYEKHSGVKVDLHLEKKLADAVRPQIQAGNTPDVIYMSIGGEGALTETLLKEDLVLPIDDLLDMKVYTEDKKVSEKIVPEFTNNSVVKKDGKLHLAPLFFSPCGLYYNKDNFKEGKYTLPETFDDFFALGEKAKADGVSLFTYPTAGYFDSYVLALLMEKGGLEFFDKVTNYDPEAWKSDDAKYVFENIAKIKPYLHPNTVAQANGEGFTKNQLSVIENQSLFVPNGSWLPGEMADAPKPEGFEWGIMPLPAVEKGQDRYSFTYFEQAYIPKEAKNVDKAKEFISYLYSDEATKLFLEKSKAVQPIYGVSNFMTDEDQKTNYAIYENGVKPVVGGFAPAPSIEGVDVKATLFESINSVMNGDKTVEQWQQEVIEAVEKTHEALQAKN